MKLKLDTKERVITFAEPVTIGSINNLISTIIPGYDSGNEFLINIDKLSKSETYEDIQKPINKSYPYSPNFEWIDYKGIDNVVTDTTCNCQPCYNAILKSGVYYINFIE